MKLPEYEIPLDKNVTFVIYIRGKKNYSNAEDFDRSHCFGLVGCLNLHLVFLQSLGKSECHRTAQERAPSPTFRAHWTGQRLEGGMWAAVPEAFVQEP